jgi:hypothetical protein
VVLVVVLHRHLFQKNEGNATKISFMVANSLVKAVCGCLLNAHLHVMAKREQELVKTNPVIFFPLQ